jgi:hypothetical protein
LEDFPFDKEQIIESGTIGDIDWVAYPAPLYGAVNGYVRLPDGHPWLDQEKFPNDWDIPTEVPWGEITYRNKGWIGFDSLHHGQVWPDSPHAYGDTPNMCEQDVIDWAEQLAGEAAVAALGEV